MRRALRVLVLGAVVALAVTAAPSVLRAQPALVTVHVGSSADDETTPVLYAIRAGLFQRAGLNVVVDKMNSGAAVAAAVAGGAIDVGKSSLLALVIGHARGVPFVMIAPAGIWDGKPEGGLIVRSDSTLRTAKDFAGKTVSAAAVLDINTVAMQAWLDENGGDSKTVKFVELPTLAAPAALAEGRVDAATLFNPAYTIATGGGKARLVAPIFNAIAKRFLLGAWFTTADYAQKNRDVVERFARVVAEASAYTSEHQAQTLDDIAGFTQLDKNLIEHMQRSTFTTTLHAADVQPVIDIAVRYHVIDKPFPASELISAAALKSYPR